MKTVLTIGGGTGTFNLVSGIRQFQDLFINTLVTMSDDGGSTGFLRDEYGVLPSGDPRRAIVALSDKDKSEFFRKLFVYRYDNGSLQGQNLGNLIMLAAEKITKDYGKALNELENLFDIENGKVYPATFELTKLIAELQDGQYVIGETNIDVPKHDPNTLIKHIRVIKEKYAKILKILQEVEQFDIFQQVLDQAILDKPQSNSCLKKVFESVDYIIFCPGDLYTSLLPNLLVGENLNLIKDSPAKKIYVSNLFTKFGETNGYNLSNFLGVFESYFGFDIFDYILAQDSRKLNIEQKMLDEYSKEGKTPVENDIKSDSRVITCDLIAQGPFVRHDKDKLAQALKKIIYS